MNYSSNIYGTIVRSDGIYSDSIIRFINLSTPIALTEEELAHTSNVHTYPNSSGYFTQDLVIGHYKVTIEDEYKVDELYICVPLSGNSYNILSLLEVPITGSVSSSFVGHAVSSSYALSASYALSSSYSNESGHSVNSDYALSADTAGTSANTERLGTTTSLQMYLTGSVGNFYFKSEVPLSASSMTGSINSNYIDLTTGSAPAYKEGRVFYDPVDRTLAYYTDRNGVTLNVGQENWIRCVNKTGIQIDDGTVVTISGSQGNRPKVYPAQSTTSSFNDFYGILGVATENIADNAEGIITTFGIIHNIDTRNYLEGDILYVSSSAGKITNIHPAPPYSVMKIGTALNSTVNGTILVETADKIELHDITGISASATPTQGDLFVYDATNKYYKNTRNCSGSYTFTNITSSLYGTASWSNNSITSSYSDNGNNALTASYLIPTNIYSGSKFFASSDFEAKGNVNVRTSDSQAQNWIAAWNSSNLYTLVTSYGPNFPYVNALKNCGSLATGPYMSGLYIDTFSDAPIILRTNTNGATNDRMKIGNAGLIQMGSPSTNNCINIGSDGHLTATGSATWFDDVRVEPTVRGTGPTIPTFEKWFSSGSSNGCYLYSFTDEAVTEKEVHFNIQMPHGKLPASNVHLHVHWVSNTSINPGVVVWALEYSWADIGVVFPQTITVTGSAVTPNQTNITGSKHYLTEFPDLVPSSTQQGLSSIMCCRLFRNSKNTADTYTDKVGLLYIDAHLEYNQLGSNNEYS